MTSVEQSEYALLGCVLEQPELATELKAEWFDDQRIAHLIGLAEQLQSSGKPVDAGTLLHATNDPAMLVLLQEGMAQCHSSANFPYWRDIIVAKSEKARMEIAARHFLARLPATNGDLRACIAELENALAKPLKDERLTLMPKDVARALTDHLEYRFNLNGKRSGIETGFCKLDYLLDGLQFAEMTILAARPGMGKTALACNIVDKVCLVGKIPTLLLSLEMTAAALSRRLLSANARIPMQRLKSGAFIESDLPKIAAFNALMCQSPIYIRESFGGMSASEAASLIRRGANRKGVKLVVLDYLQKLKSDHKQEKRTYEIAEASGVLLDAIKQTGVAFLCLAQLNRESEKDKGRRPRLNDLADSGQIERDADNVLLLDRNRAEPFRASLIIAKQRDGETGIVPLHFNGEFCQFSEETNQSEQATNPHND